VSREVRNRVAHGVMIPLLAAMFIAAVLWALSRILLSVDPDVAPWVALGFAMNILVGSALAVTLRGRRAFAFLGTVLALTIVAGGVAGAMVGEWPRHSLVAEEGEHGEDGETPAEEETTPAGEEATPAEEETTPAEEESPPAEGAVQVVAEGIAFDTDTLSLPAGTPSTIQFENRDPDSHNIAIYTEQGGEQLFMGEIFPGPATRDYDVPALEAGTYYFQCDVHPQMNGTVEVG
jgi:plastocyanin